MSRRVLIAERGPLAGYLHRTLLASGWETVAVFGERDQHAPHVEQATYASYVSSMDDPGHLVDAAVDAGCDALHPGAGSIAESESLADLCVRAGVAFVGPEPSQIRGLSDRWTTRELCIAAGVPVVPGGALLLNPQEAQETVDRLGFPLWLKDSWGLDALQIRDQAQLTQQLMERLHAGQRAWLEAHVANARHVSVPVIGDREGQVAALGVQERLSRLDDKLSFDLLPASIPRSLQSSLRDAAVAVAQAVRFSGVGSVGFLVDPSGATPCIGLRPRLTLGAVVADHLYGIRLAETQVRVALGDDLGWDDAHLDTQDVALTVRIRALTAGTLTAFKMPKGAQVETSYAPGMHAGGLLALLVVTGPTRQSCVVRASAALGGVDIQGVDTDLEQVRAQLADERIWHGHAPSD